MEFEDFKEFDIVKVEALSDFCGLKRGTYKGTVVEMKGEDKPVIIFTNITAAKWSDRGGAVPYLNFEAWGNCEITLLHRSRLF